MAKIGGKMYLARQEREAKRFNYADRIKEARKQQRLEQARETRSSLGASVFSTNASFGQQHVSLVIESAYQRVMNDLKSKADEISSRMGSVNKLI